MAKRVQLVRHAASVALNFLGLEGEVTVDVTNKTAIVHDGVTTGGTPLARKDLVNVLVATASNAGKMSAAQASALAQALADITTNAGDIATNTADIATNTGDIATNVTDIGTNTSGVAANAAAVLLRAIKDATPTNNEIVKQDGSGDLSGAGFLAAEVALLTGAQTLTDKTLTAPIINALQLNGALTGDAFSTDLAVSAAADEGVFADAAKAYTDAAVAANPKWSDLAIFSTLAATLGTTTAVPASATKVELLFTYVSNSAAASPNWEILLGTGGGTFSANVDGNCNATQMTGTAYLAAISPGASSTFHGKVTFTKLDSLNTWVGTGQIRVDGTSENFASAGTVILGAALTSVRVQTTSNVFDGASKVYVRVYS